MKNENFELRIVLIGENGVGKKSIINRFKILNCTETKEIKNKKEHIKKEIKQKSKEKTNEKSNIINENKNMMLTDKTKSKTNIKSKTGEGDLTKEEIEQKKLELRREEKRLDLMNFSKIYKIDMNFIEIKFYPCVEAKPLSFDYDLKEDDTFYEFEKKHKFTIKPLLKELQEIIISPTDNLNTQIEFLFLLCFDLSNINSFEKLLIYFNQIEKHLNLSSHFKIALIGNKLDKKKPMINEQKEGIDNLIKHLKIQYYEISSLMFFSFEKFFENLIFNNFGDLSIFSKIDAKKYFIEILNQKQNFAKAKRETFSDNNYPSPNKYNSNQFEYPYKRKAFFKLFHDSDKFNKKIFINKTGILYPPIKKNKDNDFNSFNKDRSLREKKRELDSFESNKKIQEEMELISKKPGYSFGLLTTNPIRLIQQRKLLRESRDVEIERLLTEGRSTLYKQAKSTNIKDLELNQEKYAKNRLEQQKRINEENKKTKNDIKKRHDEINEQNLSKEKEKIKLVIDKDKKYTKIYEQLQKKRIIKQKQNIIKNNSESEIPKRISEPKGKFYSPISSISNNKGFTFAHKSYKDLVKEDYPEFPLFKDDFEKLILKNKKINFVKQNGKRFPENKSEVIGDSSYIMEAQKIFEKNRNLINKNKINPFLLDRKNKKEYVLQKKKELLETQENDLKEQIFKQYNSDSNYLIREINYSQVENSSPKYTMRNKYEFGSIFQRDKQRLDDDLNNQFGNSVFFNPDISTKLSNMVLENPDFSYIRPKNPIYSFTKSKRFNSTTDNFDKKKSKYALTEANTPLVNYYDYNYTQSFLKAETSMGTGKKFEIKNNGVPGPDLYKIKRFADDIVIKGNEVNMARIKVREIEKSEKIDKERRAKIRGQWQQEKKYAIRIGLKKNLIKNINNSYNGQNENNSFQNNENEN